MCFRGELVFGCLKTVCPNFRFSRYSAREVRATGLCSPMQEPMVKRGEARFIV